MKVSRSTGAGFPRASRRKSEMRFTSRSSRCTSSSMTCSSAMAALGQGAPQHGGLDADGPQGIADLVRQGARRLPQPHQPVVRLDPPLVAQVEPVQVEEEAQHDGQSPAGSAGGRPPGASRRRAGGPGSPAARSAAPPSAGRGPSCGSWAPGRRSGSGSAAADLSRMEAGGGGRQLPRGELQRRAAEEQEGLPQRIVDAEAEDRLVPADALLQPFRPPRGRPRRGRRRCARPGTRRGARRCGPPRPPARAAGR